MRALALDRAPDMARRSGGDGPAPAKPVLAQRHSSFGHGAGSGAVTAPPIVDAGRPLEPTVRSQMESGFGRDFSAVRVHDDAKAHDNARSLDAHAYAVGNDLVFGQGAYRPDTPSGQALIGHELAHTVQQSGVQMKSAGPLPAAADAELERQADRAAYDVTSGRPVSGLSRIGQPAIFRAGNAPTAGTAPVTASPAPGGATTAVTAVAQKLPPGMTAVIDEPAGIGTTELVVSVTGFSLPLEKGLGPWVKEAYDQAGNGQRLVFSPLIEGGKVAAYKEGTEDYKSIWLGKFGFSTTQQLSLAFTTAAKTVPEVKTAMTDKAVAKLITGMATNLKASGCDIDHIVEKQMGGTSIPSNLQLLDSNKNQASGRDTYQALVKLVEAIRDPAMRGPKVNKLQLRLKAATVPAGTSDASYIVEDLLRKGSVKGTDAIKAKAAGVPVNLLAGGVGETVNITDTGVVPLDSMAKRIIPGIKLISYTRGPGGAKSKSDNVEAELDSRSFTKIGAAPKGKAGGAAPATSTVKLTATPPAAAPAAAAPAGAAAPIATAPAPATGETRELKLAKGSNARVGFYYPYLSPGTLTDLSMDAQGNLAAKGTIKPSVPFLGDLSILYAKDSLALVAPLGVDKLKPPFPGFKFTEGSLALQLSPNLIPSGNLKFAVGPAAKPVMLGSIDAKYEAGAFVATGTLTPGGKIPGISEASGTISYSSDTGWAGKLVAKSAADAKFTASAELGFTSDAKGATKVYATGGLKGKVKDADLFLGIAWSGGAVSYSGSVTVPKPLPLVEKVGLTGGYANDVLTLTGDAAIKWKAIDSTMQVTYRRKDGEDGKFSGKADVTIKTDKATGLLNINFDEAGNYWGSGSVSYQVTKDIAPKLGLELTKDRRVKVLGEVAIADIPLSKKWPGPEGGKLTFIKGIGAKFNIPTPVPGVTAYGQIKVSAGLSYGVGPVMLKGVKFNGSLYPLEDDPKVQAKLSGSLAVPGYGEIYGTFGAYIGAEVLLGAAGAKGGIEVTPALRIDGEGGLKFDAEYSAATGFTFSAEAYAQGQLSAKLKVDLVAEVYAAFGALSHTWTYNVRDLKKTLGPELRITLGKIAYGKDGVTWPDISQIKLSPENLDPMDIVKDLMSMGKADKAGGG